MEVSRNQILMALAAVLVLLVIVAYVTWSKAKSHFGVEPRKKSTKRVPKDEDEDDHDAY